MAKIKGYLICGVICLLIGSAATFAICQTNNDRLIKRMSGQVAESEARNKQLETENSRLTELNRQSQSTVDGLEKQLADSYRQSEITIAGIRKAIGEATAGLDGAGSDIDSIIAGIDSIKKLVENLP